MSNVFIPSSIRDKATRDTFIAVVKELNNVKTVTTSLTDPDIYTPGKPGDVIFSESSNSIWVFSGNTWVLAADNTTTATVTLFNKTSVISAPALPTGSFTYTFSSSVLSGSGFNGWTQTPPSLDKGEYLWSIQAPAVSSLTTDTINANEFSAPAIIGIGGEDGLAGNFSDLQGSIAQTQIPSGIIDSTRLADDSVISSKISANAVGANAIAANVITGDKIVANTITGDLIAASGIITNSAQINDAIITNAKIDNISADKITAGTLDVARLPGIGVAGATAVDSSFNTSGTVDVTVSFSGVTVGSSMIAVLTGRFGQSQASSQVGIVPTGTSVTLAHTQSTGGFVSENATPITPYSHAVSAVATSTSGTLGFRLSGTTSGAMYYRVSVSLLTFKA